MPMESMREVGAILPQKSIDATRHPCFAHPNLPKGEQIKSKNPKEITTTT